MRSKWTEYIQNEHLLFRFLVTLQGKTTVFVVCMRTGQFMRYMAVRDTKILSLCMHCTHGVNEFSAIGTFSCQYIDRTHLAVYYFENISSIRGIYWSKHRSQHPMTNKRHLPNCWFNVGPLSATSAQHWTTCAARRYQGCTENETNPSMLIYAERRYIGKCWNTRMSPLIHHSGSVSNINGRITTCTKPDFKRCKPFLVPGLLLDT